MSVRNCQLVCAALAAVAILFSGAASPVTAQDAAGSGSPNPPISIELNKLENLDDGCRAYLVVDNKTADEFETLKMDLFIFKPDGQISRLFILDIAPLKANKRMVKLFNLKGTACKDFGNLLISDISECRTKSGPADDCLSKISVSSLTETKLSK